MYHWMIGGDIATWRVSERLTDLSRRTVAAVLAPLIARAGARFRRPSVGRLSADWLRVHEKESLKHRDEA